MFSALKKSITKLVKHDFSNRRDEALLSADIDMSVVEELSFNPIEVIEKDLWPDKKSSNFRMVQDRIDRKSEVYKLLRVYFDSMSDDEVMNIAEYISLNCSSDDKDEWLTEARDRISSIKQEKKNGPLNPEISRKDVSLLSLNVRCFRNIYNKDASYEEMYCEIKKGKLILNLETLTFAK